MDRSELFAYVKSESINNLVCAASIKSREDIELMKEQGYSIAFTAEELKNTFPKLNPDFIYYNNGIHQTFYFDKENLVLFPIELYGDQTLKPYSEFEDEVVGRAEQLMSDVGNCNYFSSLLVLGDRMRMEMLNLLIEQDRCDNLYELFTNFYQTSDYGCSVLTDNSMRKLMSMKSSKETEHTKELLKAFPDKVTVYRGEGDRSSSWKDSMSWTTDINVANFFASRMTSKNAVIHIAEVDKKDIAEYFEYENECIILPENIRIKDQIQVKGIDYIEKMLPEVAEYYHDYNELITDYAEFNMGDDHGEIHSSRVLLNCLILAKEMKLTNHETDILAIASVFHDTMRDNDGDDTKHGEASAEYYKQFAKDYPALVNYEKVIEQIIKYHCLPDEIGRSEIDKRYQKLFDVFKDADALDRVRFGIRELDINQLRTPEAKSMTMVADIIRQEIKPPEPKLEQGMEMT